jgi:hypothetical protein
MVLPSLKLQLTYTEPQLTLWCYHAKTQPTNLSLVLCMLKIMKQSTILRSTITYTLTQTSVNIKYYIQVSTSLVSSNFAGIVVKVALG